jgi:hypothetical protein
MRNAQPLAIFAAALIAAGLAACDKRVDTKGRTALAPDSSAQVIGKVPAEPSGDPPGTTPVAANTTYITKETETTKKPEEGDNHSYSTTAHVTPQKSGYVDPVQAPERKKE